MTCPKCGRLTWPYDDNTLTCKAGHHTATLAATAQPAQRKSRYHPGYVAVGVLAGSQLYDLIDHCVKAFT